MSTSYPGALDSYSVKVDGVTDVVASHVNNLQDAVVAIQTLLGVQAENLPPDNIFINGGFDIWQRTTNDTSLTTTRKYVADRWAIMTSAGTLSNVQRTTTVRTGARSKYSLEMVGAIGVTTVVIDQRIESLMVGKYKRTLHFSAYVYNGSGASFTPKIYISTPSAADNWTSSTVRNGSGSGENLQACADSTWTKVTWSADVSGYTNIDNGLEVKIEIPSGSMVSGDTIRLAEMNLTPNVASVFKQAPIGIELMLCQRYYQKSYAYSVVPGSAAQSYRIAPANQTNQLVSNFPLLPEMRTTPTVKLYSFNGTINKVSTTGGADVGTTVTASLIGSNIIAFINDSGTAFSVGSYYIYHYTAEADL